jgi:hypothetical protein
MIELIETFSNIEFNARIAKRVMEAAMEEESITPDELRRHMDLARDLEQRSKTAYILLLREMNNLNASNHEKAIP